MAEETGSEETQSDESDACGYSDADLRACDESTFIPRVVICGFVGGIVVVAGDSALCSTCLDGGGLYIVC